MTPKPTLHSHTHCQVATGKDRTWICKTISTRQTVNHHTIWHISKTSKQSKRTDTQPINDNPCRPNHHRLRKPKWTVGKTTKRSWKADS